MKRDYFAYILALVSIIISVFISYYFYHKSIKYPQLHYITSTFPQSIFNAQKDSNPPFKISKKDGTPLTSSVYLANHKIWNNGTQPILATDVLKPITVSFTDKNSSIMAVSIDKSSQEVTDCNVCLNTNTNKSFTVSFKILEPQDGCLLKIFYTGSEYPALKIDSTIIGMNSIIFHNITFDKLINQPNYWRYIGYIPEAILFFAFSTFLFLYMKTRNLDKKSFWFQTVIYLVVILEIAMIAEVFVYRSRYILFDSNNHISSPSTEKWVSQNEIHPSPDMALPKSLGDKTAHHP